MRHPPAKSTCRSPLLLVAWIRYPPTSPKVDFQPGWPSTDRTVEAVNDNQTPEQEQFEAAVLRELAASDQD